MHPQMFRIILRMTPIIDATRLKSLADGDAILLDELIALYVEQTAQDLENLRAALQVPDIKEIHRLAHGCKGASETYGMLAIVPPLERLVMMAKAGGLTAEAMTYFSQAEAGFAQIKDHLAEENYFRKRS